MMAAEHVLNGKKGDKTIFNVFDGLLKATNKKGRSCAALVDFLKSNDNKVGSSTPAAYTSKRLIRGLAASEKEKQNLFFSNLCTLLSLNILTAKEVLSTLEDIIKNSGTSKNEKNTLKVTQLLAQGAIITTGQVSDLSVDEQESIVKEVINSIESSTSLNLAALAIFLKLSNDSSKQLLKNVFIPVLKESLSSRKNGNSHLPTICGLLYTKHTKLLQKLVDTQLGGRRQLLENMTFKCYTYKGRVQEELLRNLCVEMSLNNIELKLIWEKLVDKEVKSTKKWNAYLLLVGKIILDVNPDVKFIQHLLHPKLLQILITTLQVNDKSLKSEATYLRAKHVVGQIIARLTDKDTESKLKMAILKSIFAQPKGIEFDKKTKTNLVYSLINSLDVKYVEQLADGFMTTIHEGLTANENDKDRNPKNIELNLGMLIKTLNTLKKDSSSLMKYFIFIFNVAFTKTYNISSNMRSKSTDLFFKCIELHNINIEEAASILNELVLYAEKNKKQLAVPLQEKDLTQWENMLEANRKLGSKTNDKKYVAVRLLFLHMGLLMFRDSELASTTINELLQCYQRIKAKKKSLSEEEPNWIEVTVDLLLAMLSRENKLLRHVVSSVFPSMVPHLTATALQQIVDALDPSARNDVLKHVDSDDSDDEEEESEEDDEEEEEESEVEQEEETVNDKLRMAVRNALGYSAALTDDESVDMDDMNEEEEKRLNESLASAFRLFKPNKGSKKKQTKDDEALMHFRVRVLDLVEIIVSNNPPLATCIDLITPLFSLLEFAIKDPHQKPLQNRLEAILNRLGSVKKFRDESLVMYQDLVTTLKSLFERDTSVMVYIEMAHSITECCSLLLRASASLDQQEEDESLELVFSNLLIRHFKTNDRKIPGALFETTLRMLWNGNWKLAQDIMTLLLDSDLKLFRKFKLIELLEVFYRNDRLQSTATDDSKKALSTFESKFVKKFTKSLKEYETKKSMPLLPNFYGRIISFIQSSMHSRERFRASCKPAPSWSSVVQYLLDNIHMLTQQKLRNRLLHLARQCDLVIPDKESMKIKAKKHQEEDKDQVVPQKRKSEESNSDDDEEDKKRKKKKSSVEAHRLKKEARELREAASSQGLETVSFASVDVSAIKEEEDVVAKKKKKVQDETIKKKKNKLKV